MDFKKWYHQSIDTINDGGHVSDDEYIIPDTWLANAFIEVALYLRVNKAGY